MDYLTVLMFLNRIFWKDYFVNDILVKINYLKQKCIEYVELAMCLLKVI